MPDSVLSDVNPLLSLGYCCTSLTLIRASTSEAHKKFFLVKTSRTFCIWLLFEVRSLQQKKTLLRAKYATEFTASAKSFLRRVVRVSSRIGAWYWHGMLPAEVRHGNVVPGGRELRSRRRAFGVGHQRILERFSLPSAKQGTKYLKPLGVGRTR